MVEVTNVRFGEIEIDGKVYYSDMIVWWGGRIEYRTKSHEFGMSEFLKLAEKKPEMIIIGTGIDGMCRVLPEVDQAAKDKGIEIFKEVSPKAAEMFNAFLADGKKAVAVLHATC